MESYRIVCATTATPDDPSSPIVMVGTGVEAGIADRHWYADQVVAAIRRGATFYTETESGERAGVMAVVERGGWSLRSSPGTPPQATLRRVRACREWTQAMPGQVPEASHPSSA